MLNLHPRLIENLSNKMLYMALAKSWRWIIRGSCTEKNTWQLKRRPLGASPLLFPLSYHPLITNHRGLTGSALLQHAQQVPQCWTHRNNYSRDVGQQPTVGLVCQGLRVITWKCYAIDQIRGLLSPKLFLKSKEKNKDFSMYTTVVDLRS